MAPPFAALRTAAISTRQPFPIALLVMARSLYRGVTERVADPAELAAAERSPWR